MGDGRIFLKSLRDTSFNKDLSNESTFGRIHLAGQYRMLTICKSSSQLAMSHYVRMIFFSQPVLTALPGRNYEYVYFCFKSRINERKKSLISWVFIMY